THLPYPSGVEVVPVVSAADMFEAVISRMEEMDIIVKAAAVADYRPTVTADRKLKKTDQTMTLVLEKTPDILQTIGEKKTDQVVVGFAAETNDLALHTEEKLRKKN